MPRIGYFLSCEEYSPAQLLEQAKLAEDAGFEALWISDHYHPWNDEQGNSAYVWSMIGAISQVSSLPITTAVTCPIIRQHPAIVAQAAATAKVLTGGKFTLGIGTGEALNEHILGDQWPNTEVRLEMLEEAVEVMRKLWAGGFVTHHGKHYTVEHAQVYTLPEEPVQVYVSAFGPKALDVAARIGDGYCSTMPDKEVVDTFKQKAGPGKPTQVGYKVCYGEDEEAAVKTAHRLWANEKIPGEAAQVLYSPKQFEQVSELVTEDMVREGTVCGNDVDEHVQQFREYADAGYDEVFIATMGPEYPGFFEFYKSQVLPRIR
ncbi:G6PDH family F420-dependent oxidoreductase [Motilibacter rhizosphaerae]|uniref:G6PDH family F420-dependent oxidoreductase n=1 Tax=Motilibacter rhizosphaerae TaxID=598652 RepID=A0A4Q7NSA8_9ACTN|nr:TIGR03557 family F420-dependent LLM class oxidoreductase [Motilibacter rhizosphaerae]RZS89658.1 G6PDH family F420-dependent oxidoreductase [Motilibacter rhizosphaerae]